MKDIDTLLKEVKRIHFIGIGGSGMCPLAEILLSLGYQLSGSDNNDTETFRRIEKEGAKSLFRPNQGQPDPGYSAGDLHQRHLKGQRGAGMG